MEKCPQYISSEKCPQCQFNTEKVHNICDRLQENQAQRGTLRKKFFLHLQSCRRPNIELSKFYRRSLSRSRYNRPNCSLPSA